MMKLFATALSMLLLNAGPADSRGAENLCGYATFGTDDGNPGILVVLDLDRVEAIGSILVGAFPSDVVFSPDGKAAYVANNNDPFISVVDTASSTVAAAIPVPRPVHIAFTPDSSRAFVTIEDRGDPDQLIVIDTKTRAVVETIRLVKRPVLLSITPNGERAIVIGISDLGVTTLSILDIASHPSRLIDKLPVITAERTSIVLTPDGQTAYLATDGGGLVVIDLKEVSVTETIDASLQHLALSPSGERLYGTSSGRALAIGTERIGEDQHHPIVTINLGQDGACTVALSPDGRHLYGITETGEGYGLVVVNTRSLAVTERITLPVRPTLPDQVPYSFVNLAVASLEGGCVAPQTPSPPETPVPTPTLGPCRGDCDGDGAVAVNELVRAVGIALGQSEVGTCLSVDSDADGSVSIAELIGAVNAALNGCGD